MSLPNDFSRCTGSSLLGKDARICPRREKCQRYLDLIARPDRDEAAHFPVAEWLCREGDDRMIPVVE